MTDTWELLVNIAIVFFISVAGFVFWLFLLISFLDAQEPQTVYEDGDIRVSERSQGQCIVSEVSYGVLR